MGRHHSRRTIRAKLTQKQINSSQDSHFGIPFGGYKQSGIGRELGQYALSAYTQVKAVHGESALGDRTVFAAKLILMYEYSQLGNLVVVFSGSQEFYDINIDSWFPYSQSRG